MAETTDTQPITAEQVSEEHSEEGGIHVSLKPEVIFNIGPMPVTNSMLSAYTVSLFLIVLTVIIRLKLKTVPGKLQFFYETVLTSVYGFIKDTTKNEPLTKWFFPVFMTLVMFFWTANMANFIPGLLALRVNGAHLYRPALADYALVIGVTLCMFIFSQFTVFKFVGVKMYLKHFFNFSSPINFFVGLLEMIGEVARVLSLSFRLFGNIFSEEVLMLVMLSIAPFVAPIPFAMLGLLTATIQAILFPLLLLLFVNISVEEGLHAQHAQLTNS
ncbi:MAG: FoF1 ATP synthase subunit a [Patescibacteria group bacterium]|jgi:F-type H+-transporting ATPase subunit a